MKYYYKILIVLSLILLKSQLIYPQWVKTNGPKGGEVNCLAVCGNYIFAGTDSGISRSTNNGATWIKVGLDNMCIYAFVVNGPTIFAGAHLGVFRATNYGNDSWGQVVNGFTSYDATSFAVSGSNIFAGSVFGGIYITTNNGTNWTQVLNLQSGWVNSITSIGTNIFAGTGGGILYSIDNGKIWWSNNLGLTETIILSVMALGNNVFAGTNGSGVFLNTNIGTQWKQMNNGLTNNYVHCFSTYGTNIFAGTDGGLFLSTNNGANWTLAGLANYHVYSIAISGSNIFAGTYEAGVWRRPLSEIVPTINITSPYGGENWQEGTSHNITWTSSNVTNVKIEYTIDNGSNWLQIIESTPASTGSYSWTIPNKTSTQCKIRISDVNNLIIYGTSLNSFTIMNPTSLENESANYSYKLFQNYPNPFNPATTIKYSLAKEGNVKLTVYNAMGSKVATIVNEYKPTGSYSVQFIASKFPSGIYLYRMESGNYSDSKKFMLLK